MSIKGILFDKDGTLIDFFEVWGRHVGRVVERILEFYHLKGRADLKLAILERLGVHGIVVDPEGDLAWKPYGLIAEDIAEILDEALGRHVSIPELKQQLIDIFYDEISASISDYPVFTDMKKLVGKLEKMGIKIGLATTDEFKSTRLCMERMGIDKDITFYGTADRGLPEKPDGALIHRAAEKWGIKDEEIAMVGDTPNDMRFAHNGRGIGIAVLSGLGKREDLQPLADYVIDSVDDLVPLLAKCAGGE